MKAVKTRKAWVCDECRGAFEAGTTAYVGRYGVWLHVDGVRVHADCEGRLCERCARPVAYRWETIA